MLQKHGTVLTEFLSDKTLTSYGQEMDDNEIYERDVKFLVSADVLVAEVSTPSLGVGYEVAKAESLGKKTLCVFRSDCGRRLSAMIAGNRNIQNESYTKPEELVGIFEKFFSSF